MVSIDEAAVEVRKYCGEYLDNKDFLGRFPVITSVSALLHANETNAYSVTGEYQQFQKLGVRNISGFIRLLADGNEQAKTLYRNISRAAFKAELKAEKDRKAAA